jgi:hypothetical protein
VLHADTVALLVHFLANGLPPGAQIGGILDITAAGFNGGGGHITLRVIICQHPVTAAHALATMRVINGTASVE